MSPQGAPNQNTITTITDVYGQVILEVRQNEYLVVQDDGSFESNSHYRYITLVDGSSWSPQMMWQKPPIFIGVCGVCRRPSLLGRKTHGLVMLARARLCECGVLCCPRHRVLCSDNRWRCHRCARKYRLKSLVKPLFFEKVEE
jgi:hypothetical protein